MAVTLDDAKTFLGVTNDARIAQLQGVLDAAVEMVQARVGSRGTTVTYTVRPTGRALVLPVTRLSAVTAVTDPGGASVTLADCDVDLSAGVITLPSVTTSGYKKAYTVDASTVASAAVDEATLIIVKHLWESRRGREGRESLYAEPDDVVPAGFAMPRRAVELLTAVEAPGFA